MPTTSLVVHRRWNLALTTLFASLVFLVFHVGSIPEAHAFESLRTGRAARGAGETPRAQKLQALARLEDFRESVEDGTVDASDLHPALEELEDAIEELEESLDPQFWAIDDGGKIDGLHLDSERGHHVFHEERHCAQEIFDAIRHGGIRDLDAQDELLAIVDVLVQADRQLAEVAIVEAQAQSGSPDEIAEALARFAEGDELAARAATREDLSQRAALLYEAMDGSYRHAWDAAIDAVDPDSQDLRVDSCPRRRPR